MTEFSTLFKKISFGCKFDLKKYKKDAELFQLIRYDSTDTHSKPEIPLMKTQKRKNDPVSEPNPKVHKAKTRQDFGIQVFGTDLPELMTSFSQLSTPIPLYLRESMKNSNFLTPTPIQMQTIPLMLKDRHVLACAPTGSGKTFAYLFPLFISIKIKKIKNLFALIILPTKELSHQIFNELTVLTIGSKLSIFLTTKSSLRKSKNFSSFQIIISTPQRIVDLLNANKLDLSTLEWLILDEGDLLFGDGKKGFRNQISVIYNACSSKIKPCIFSATIGQDVEQWSDIHLENPAKILVGTQTCAPESIQQQLLFVGQESGKILAIRNMIHTCLEPPVLIFVNSIDKAKELFTELLFDGISVDIIHADKTETQRSNSVNSFRVGKTWILITTDLMSRGIDFKGIRKVINFDPPTSMVNYVHRIGRTGRAGTPGVAITFYTEKDIPLIKSITPILKAAHVEYPAYLDK